MQDIPGPSQIKHDQFCLFMASHHHLRNQRIPSALEHKMSYFLSVTPFTEQSLQLQTTKTL